jgi:hypothetical protein
VLKAIICGSVFGAVLGYLARVLTAQSFTFAFAPMAISVLGTIVMSFILAIVLSRQENAEGFVTLEDFYGAFIAGVLLGYTGTTYFETLMNALAPKT